MNQDFDIISQMQAITISREYGSGGGEIATRLARRVISARDQSKKERKIYEQQT